MGSNLCPAPLIPARDRHRSQLRRRSAVGARQTDHDRRRPNASTSAAGRERGQPAEVGIQPDAAASKPYFRSVIFHLRAPAIPAFSIGPGTEFEENRPATHARCGEHKPVHYTPVR